MSMPNIPDIKPEIDITFQDAINLLLTSIAKEEISLSKLIDAETNKLSFILNKCEKNEANIQDILKVNDSINKTIVNLSKMQMLLQFKLENVEKLMPNENACCLMVKNKGVVLNKSDKFHCEDANLCVFVSPRDCNQNTVHYRVGDAHNSLCMTANANDFKIECPCATQPDKIKVWGKGQATKTLKCVKDFMNVNFELSVWDNKNGKNGFQMLIDDCENSNFSHNSGFIKIC